MKKIYILGIIIIGLFCLVSFSLAGRCDPGKICNPLDADTFEDLLMQIVKAVGTLITTLGTIMLIVAGILYLTSAGSPERMGKAKTALIYAIAGIAIGLAASAIVDIIKDIVKVSP